MKDVSPEFSDERVQAWMEEHLSDLQQSITGQRILYTSLVVSFLVGLAAHVSGYFLLSSSPSEPFGLFADLLHALGWSLWTGVVVAVFLQVIPEAKRRQISAAVEAYKAFQREKATRDA
jgi:putative copper export protein